MVKEKDLLFKKYLALLGLEISNPTLEFLTKIVKAHITKIPFENISKLLLKKRGLNYIPNLSEYLEGVERYRFGGTCYANNYYLFLLLKNLGFDVKLCGADMHNPDVHLISIVTTNNKDFIVDCGYAAPFFAPLPRDLNEDYIFNFGEEKYIIKQKDDNGNTKVELYIDGKLQHWYTAKPQSRKIEEFKKVIEDSYADDATFMNAIRITRFTEIGSLVLKNLFLTETVDNKSSTTRIKRIDLPSIVKQKFGIPAEVVAEATSHLKELKDIYD
jgi:arylamine N-acetyltransferase